VLRPIFKLQRAPYEAVCRKTWKSGLVFARFFFFLVSVEASVEVVYCGAVYVSHWCLSVKRSAGV